MIITKTPYRISFFGGGSDYPEWVNENLGEVISATINKYIYISCRFLPDFFEHKFRVSYSTIEEVKRISDIKHYAVRKILQKYSINNKGLEIHYDGDLPSNSGMASSACFVVGLLNALNNLSLKSINKRDLANLAIHYEQKILKEVTGYQDQIITSYGGFNNIKFYPKKDFVINKINISEQSKIELNKNLFLVYSGIKRYAHNIASTFVSNLHSKKRSYILNILEHVRIAKNLLANKDFDDFGRLLNESWDEKKKLSKAITNHYLDDIYSYALSSGALGGKLLGAGGGGFFIFYVPENNHKKFKTLLQKKFLIINFKFEDHGSTVIHKSLY
jgi:D-glycero-alpha-D-manno-heptose-7-phosphate kinase